MMEISKLGDKIKFDNNENNNFNRFTLTNDNLYLNNYSLCLDREIVAELNKKANEIIEIRDKLEKESEKVEEEFYKLINSLKK